MSGADPLHQTIQGPSPQSALMPSPQEIRALKGCPCAVLPVRVSLHASLFASLGQIDAFSRRTLLNI